ncbi:hypothetical protein DFJ74DRAFT_695754 [Hyaloraphidium curvatum]|nr:hypothetical protein DFJ74DRAFT_695754 [Hyaloraphidium curvatum]
MAREHRRHRIRNGPHVEAPRKFQGRQRGRHQRHAGKQDHGKRREHKEGRKGCRNRREPREQAQGDYLRVAPEKCDRGNQSHADDNIHKPQQTGATGDATRAAVSAAGAGVVAIEVSEQTQVAAVGPLFLFHKLGPTSQHRVGMPAQVRVALREGEVEGVKGDADGKLSLGEESDSRARNVRGGDRPRDGEGCHAGRVDVADENR